MTKLSQQDEYIIETETYGLFRNNIILCCARKNRVGNLYAVGRRINCSK